MNSCARLVSLILLYFPVLVFGQIESKKALDYSNFSDWNRITSRQISNNGQWVAFTVTPVEGDPTLMLYDANSKTKKSFERGDKPKFSADNQQLVFWLKPHQDSLKMMRRQKVKKDKLPKDTLCIYHLKYDRIEKLPKVKSYKLPEKWSGWLAYQMEPDKRRFNGLDSLIKPTKKESSRNGSRLFLRKLESTYDYKIDFVKDYEFAKERSKFLIYSKGDGKQLDPGVYLFDTNDTLFQSLHTQGTDYKRLTFSDDGSQVGFLANMDTTESKPEPFNLIYGKIDPSPRVNEIANNQSDFLPKSWIINQNGILQFAEDNQKLYFGISPEPILQDTSILDEEIVNVEVWTYKDERLYPQQNAGLGRDQKKAYSCVYHVNDNKFVQLGNENYPEVRLGNEGNAPFVLAYNDKPYLRQTSWEGGPSRKDVYLINTKTGAQKLIQKALRATPRLSPAAKYAYWYSSPDSAWFAYSTEKGWTKQLTNNKTVLFYDELNDRPMHPSSYGITGWTTNDDFIIINDRYDLWLIDPTKNLKDNNMTQGRSSKKRYRYIQTDPEERAIEEVGPMLLHFFDEQTKEEGYVIYDLHTTIKKELTKGNYSYSRSPMKAKEANSWIFTKEDFNTFPDLHYSKDLKTSEKISDANPQQAAYLWGTIEPYQWTSLDGQKLNGLLVKPENFDPTKKYPLIVNFYERSSNGIHRHRAPYPGRSTISYSFYASRGYLIFNPDVPYKVGYPGESAYNAVISGVTSLVDKGFVDKDNIALQGHSWGGYQIAYLLTRTNMFKCAESGAPVVNMISAYGGIRWGSGLSRMFQYEHTQSRIGGTLWETPLRYIENSPIFTIDKITTPVLILHNDNDGAVPWYQGIEFFVAMRRLGKPAWMLNYNGEPHWPVKLQNRIDFQTRMSQFFDHYLMGKAMPGWMERGVPRIEKGIRQGIGIDKERRE